jgi:hypothetical protein
VHSTRLDGVRNVFPVAVGWRRVLLRCGDPIDVRQRLAQHHGEPQDLADELLVEFRRRMQSKLDELVELSKPVTRQFARSNPFAGAVVPADRSGGSPAKAAEMSAAAQHGCSQAN